MISNASKILQSSEERKEEAMNYALIAFLRTPALSVSLENFRLITHLYFMSLCNGFGIADDQMLRIGTGLYHPSVSIGRFKFTIEPVESFVRSELYRSFQRNGTVRDHDERDTKGRGAHDQLCGRGAL